MKAKVKRFFDAGEAKGMKYSAQTASDELLKDASILFDWQARAAASEANVQKEFVKLIAAKKNCRERKPRPR